MEEIIKVIGLKGCNKCVNAKNKLKENEYDFMYLILQDLPAKERVQIIRKARKISQSDAVDFPIIMRNDKIIQLSDLI